MKTYSISEVLCPTCGQSMDHVTDFSQESPQPEPGAWSLCWYCHTWGCYGDDLSLRPLTQDELLRACSTTYFLNAMLIQLQRKITYLESNQGGTA